MDVYEIYGYGNRKFGCFVTFATIDPCLCVIPSVRSDVYQFNVAFEKEVTDLPNDFDNRFPNLETFNASSCSIKSISNENFERMTNLKYLYLDNNQIEAIAGDTFVGLSALVMIHLRKQIILVKNVFDFHLFCFGTISENNHIRFIDIEAFHPIKNLAQVLLKQNECIKRNFCGKRQVKIIADEIGKLCNGTLTSTEAAAS